MDMLKRVLAVLGAPFGLLALYYLVSAWSLTLKNFGLSVEGQLIAQRVITPLVFVALGALAVSCEYFRRVLLHSGTEAGILLRMLRFVAVVVLPVVIVIFTLQTPFWSYKSPWGWDRPRFDYGWPLPWKGEKMGGAHMICPFLNLFLWTLYLMVIVGYRRIKHYLIMLGVMLVLFGLYAKCVGIKTVHRGRGRTIADGQCVSTTRVYPSNALSGFAEALVCPKSRFSTARIFYDLSLFDKMIVNSATCTKLAKSISRVEHVEWGDDR